MIHSTLRALRFRSSWLRRYRQRHSSLLAICIAICVCAPTANAQFELVPENVSSQNTDQEDEGRFDSLIELITQSIGSWRDIHGVGGTIHVMEEQGVLVISQTTEVHEELEDLITTLRRAAQREFEVGTKQSAQRPVSLDISRHARQHERIEQILSSESVALQFFNTELAQVFEFIGDEFQLRIAPEWKEIEQTTGITSDTPITVNFHVSLRSALRVMFRELGLSYTIKDEMLLINSTEFAKANPVVRVYLVDDLFDDPFGDDDIDSADAPAIDADADEDDPIVDDPFGPVDDPDDPFGGF